MSRLDSLAEIGRTGRPPQAPQRFYEERVIERFAHRMRRTRGYNEDAATEPSAPIEFEESTPPTPWPRDAMPPAMAAAAEAIAEHVQAPPALAGFAVLSAVAHVAQRLVNAQHPKKGSLPASLYVLTAAESGARKSECFSLANWPTARRERKLREEYKAEAARLRAEAERCTKKKDRLAALEKLPPDPRTIFVDTTTQAIELAFVNGSAPALSLSTDEAGVFFGGHSLKSKTRLASLSALTRLFDGGGVHRDRVGEGQSGFRYGVRFGLFLSAQPVALREALHDPLLRGQGFLPRFLFCEPPALFGSRLHDHDTLSRRAADDARVARYWRVLEALNEAPVKTDRHGGLDLPAVELAPEAVEVWLAFYNETERRQADEGDLAHLRAFASRAGEQAARVAAVYAAWRYYADRATAAPTVTGEDMRRACALVGFSLAEWARQAAGVRLSQAERDARELLAWLHRKGFATINRLQLGKLCPNFLRKDTPRRNAAVDELVRRCWLIPGDDGFAVARK